MLEKNMLICIFGTMMDNRMVGYIISRSENEEGGIQRGTCPIWHTILLAKSSVLYSLSVRLRKVGVCESGVNATADKKSLVSVSVSITEIKLIY